MNCFHQAVIVRLRHEDGVWRVAPDDECNVYVVNHLVKGTPKIGASVRKRNRAHASPFLAGVYKNTRESSVKVAPAADGRAAALRASRSLPGVRRRDVVTTHFDSIVIDLTTSVAARRYQDRQR